MDATQKKVLPTFLPRIFYVKTKSNSLQIIKKKILKETQICFPRGIKY